MALDWFELDNGILGKVRPLFLESEESCSSNGVEVDDGHFGRFSEAKNFFQIFVVLGCRIEGNLRGLCRKGLMGVIPPLVACHGVVFSFVGLTAIWLGKALRFA